MTDLESPDALQDDLRRAWHRFVDMLVPLRPPLYAYCRRLVGGDVWDAEDLVQDTLLRAFGRGRLAEPEGGAASRRPRPSEKLIDAFLDRYHARDVAGLVELMAPGGSAENTGFGLEYGKDSFRDTHGFLYKAVHGHEEWPAELQPESVRIERGALDGEPLILCFSTRRGREALEQILRFEEADGHIARLRGYAFCPETMRAVAEMLGVHVRTGLYRVPTPAPGEYWPDPDTEKEASK